MLIFRGSVINNLSLGELEIGRRRLTLSRLLCFSLYNYGDFSHLLRPLVQYDEDNLS